MSVRDQNRLEELLRKYLAKDYTRAEAEELFDLLRFIHQPEMLDQFFETRWRMEDRPETDVVWEDMLRAREEMRMVAALEKRKARTKRIGQWSVAASAIMLISILWWNFDATPEYSFYATGFGETQEILLEDGTKIVLNANSELTWYRRWAKEGIRKVELKGEAYFDVARVELEGGSVDSMQRLPFQVKTKDMVIDVLGTAFNVTKRKGETTIFLERGSVQLDLLDDLEDSDEIDSKSNEEKFGGVRVGRKVKMIPGEVVTYSSQTQRLEKSEDHKSKELTEWKEGTLVYHDIEFMEMLEHLQGIYGKNFEVKDKGILERRVTVGFPFEDWETVRKLMEVTLQVRLTTDANGNILIK